MKIIFATSNQHKLKEVKSITPQGFEIVSLKDVGFEGELPETHETIEENSLEKAEYFSGKFNTPCFAEDTGLFIDSINGEPGVYSARYAGDNASFEDNVNKVLAKMDGVENKKAKFKTVITYYSQGSFVQFEGVTQGKITVERFGGNGFGYDPIFIPDGSLKTFAQMSLDEKNIFSHRKKSFDLFANHLKLLTVLKM